MTTPISRRQFLERTAAGAAASALGTRLALPAAAAESGPPPASGAPRPHVVIFLIDDLGWADVGYHNPGIKTPQIDRLAAAGVRCEQFYVQPLCSPTRAALLTGRYPMRYGLQVGVVRPFARYGLPLEERTLAQALREAGYETGITGKWHIGHCERAYLPTQRGFDHQYGHYNGAIDYFKHERDGGLDWHRDDKALYEDGYSTTLIAAEAVRLIENRDKAKPLFLYVPFNAVHAPMQAPEDYLDRLKDLAPERRVHDAMVLAMDDAIGRITAALDRAGMTSNTLIIFMSDNGDDVTNEGTPWRARKASAYEGGVRVPTFALWPGRLKAGTVRQEPMHIVDWYPTLLRLAGARLEQPLPLDGRDIWPTLAEGKPSPHEAILLNTTPVGGALRCGDWKIVVGTPNAAVEDLIGVVPLKSGKRMVAPLGPNVELFDLAQDPGEKTNLADQQPEKLKALRARYDAYARAAVPPRNHPKPQDFKVPKVWGEKD